MNPKHIILIGFKNSGKSAIGRRLANKIKRKFIDLDDEIMALQSTKSGEMLSCREIMNKRGENFFRKLEHEVLEKIITNPHPCVIAFGGGTPLLKENRDIMENHIIVHITAPKGVIFERIMINGKPAFFPQTGDPFDSFQKIWNEREPLFKKIAHILINNTGSIHEAISAIIKQLNSQFNFLLI